MKIHTMNKDNLIFQISQGLTTWSIATANNTTQMNVRYWLKKFNLKTQISQRRSDGTRLCLTCKQTKPKTEFYFRGTKYASHCKICHQQKYKERSKISKQLAVDYLGGECSRCGYNKNLAALDFHHLDPKSKNKEASMMHRGSFHRIIPELDKCILLCANCHREEHNLP